MRIECPGCGAVYDIPDRALPAPGRDVQCAACGAAWFLLRSDGANAPSPGRPDANAPRDVAPGPAGSGHGTGPARQVAPTVPTDEDHDEDPGDAAPAPPDPPRREIDPAVLDILRSEAEVELRARGAANAPPQGDAPGARGRLARLTAAERGNAAPPSGGAAAQDSDEGLVEDPRAAQRDPRPPLLGAPGGPGRAGPHGRDLPVRVGPAERAEAAQRRHRAGFRLGFAVTAGLCGAALGLYLLAAAPGGAERLPFAGEIRAHGDRVQTALVAFLRRFAPGDGA